VDAAEFLDKPFDVPQLLHLVDRYGNHASA
jgi:hypothetical protein